MSEQLKECPFCGSNADFVQDFQRAAMMVRCLNRNCLANCGVFEGSREDAAKIWNTSIIEKTADA